MAFKTMADVAKVVNAVKVTYGKGFVNIAGYPDTLQKIVDYLFTCEMTGWRKKDYLVKEHKNYIKESNTGEVTLKGHFLFEGNKSRLARHLELDGVNLEYTNIHEYMPL